MKRQVIRLIYVFASALLLQSCMSLYDVRPKMLKKEGITEENTQKGKDLINKVIEKQGHDKFDEHDDYSFTGFDTWKEGKLGEIAKIWPDFKTTLEFKFSVDSLNGSVLFLNGEREGTIAGISSSEYYEIENDTIEFKDRNAESNIRAAFGLSHIQYFFQILNHLRNAPIISFAGTEEFNGNNYDLVFATWGKAEPHIEHDQFLVWINQETGMMDYIEYSVRDPYVKPIGYKKFGGNIQYTDYKEIDGIWISHKQLVYSFKLRTDQEKFLHFLKLSDFQFDDFDVNELSIDKSQSK